MILYKKIFLKKSLSIKKKKKIIEKKYKKIFKLVNKMYPNKKKKIKSFLNFWRSHLLNSLRLRFKNRFLKIVLKNFYKYMFFFYQHALRQHINIRLILFKYRMENMLQSALNKEINIIPYCFVITSYDKRYLLKKRKIQNINSRGPSFILDETGDISHQFYQPLLHNKAFAISFMLKKLWHRIAKKKRAKHFFRGKRVELFTYYIYYIIVGLVLQDIKIFTFAAAKHLNGLRSHKAFLKVWARFLKYSLRLLKGVTPFPIKGIYIVMSGRINEKDRARVRKIWLGPFPKLHHAGYYTDYCFTTFHGRRGDYGLKVWFTYFKYVKARKDEVQKIPEKQDSPL